MLWFVINTDLTITTEKLVELFATMLSVKELLDLPSAKIAEIDRNLHTPSQRKEAYLDHYATGHPCPSWRQVAEVLRGVGLDHQAHTVESTYVQGRMRYKYMCTLYHYYLYRRTEK
jgi:hypothetical protein